MKEQIHTIPIAQALESGDECPFCDLHRQMEQRTIRYFAGPSASYMEPTVRAITNRTGFCQEHSKQLFDYGNPLGTALMIQTHYEAVMLQLQAQMENYEIPAKKFRVVSFFIYSEIPMQKTHKKCHQKLEVFT